uniref:Putative heat shock protein n=1 Tax=Trypanosoma vivax (strain Y486) TaxID=1055687 RepID=G0U230_TRYVY|nr:putative heat shock protein [Trypanosoma vivax Y486]
MPVHSGLSQVSTCPFVYPSYSVVSFLNIPEANNRRLTKARRRPKKEKRIKEMAIMPKVAWLPKLSAGTAQFLLIFASTMLLVAGGQTQEILAVDIGSEWTKAALLVGGATAVPRPTVVLNDQTNRKSPQCIAFRFLPYKGNDTLRGVERIFAEQALAFEPRFPRQVVCGSSVLAGHFVSSDSNGTVRTTEEGIPTVGSSILSYTVVPRHAGGAAAIHLERDGGAAYKPAILQLAVEEVVGMILGSVKRSAEKYVMVYDMGSTRTEVSVFRFTSAVQRDQQRGTITMIAHVANESLGGKAFDRCLAQRVERELFPHATPTPIRPVLGTKLERGVAARRAVVSLLRAANAARERLSVNQDVPFLVPDIREGGGDFVTNISRAFFEGACGELFDEAVRLRDRAIANTNGIVRVPRDLVRLELVGGATRMPRLQDRLSGGYGRPADRTLNSDEAVVSGAALMSRMNSRRFNIVEPMMNDVYFSVAPSLGGQEGIESKERLKREATEHMLFEKNTTLVPISRLITFQNRTGNFTLTLKDRRGFFVRTTSVSGVEEATEAARAVSQRLSSMDTAGRVNSTVAFERGEVVVEVTVGESGVPFVSTAYLNATFTRRWTYPASEYVQSEMVGRSATGARPDEPDKEVVSSLTPEGVVEQDQSGDGARAAGTKGANSTHNVSAKDEGSAHGNQTTGGGQEAPVRGPGAVDSNVEQIFRRFPLRFVLVFPLKGQSGVNMDKEEAVASRNRLRAFQRIDDERLLRSTLRNDIESFVVHYKSLDSWTTPMSNGSSWRDVVASVSNWLDDAREDVNITELKEKHKLLKELNVEQ